MNYYVFDAETGETPGPFLQAQLEELLGSGQLKPDTPCCREGDEQWGMVSDYCGASAGIVQELPPRGGAFMHAPADERFSFDAYTLRRKFFSFPGASFHIFASNGTPAFFSRQKAFKLKEDIRLFEDESMQKELLSIQARQILDFSAAYDVIDPVMGVKVGALRRKGFSSMFRDSWLLLDADDLEIGQLKEDSMALALVRRFVMNLIPQSFTLQIGEETVAEFKQHFNPFIFKLDIVLKGSAQGQRKLDTRMALAAAVLLAAIEGRQK